ncbi:transglutaminase-like cysteine peptidase [Methylorubrum aminovorans]
MQAALPPASGTIKGERVLAPMAFIRFCMHRPDECVRDADDRIGSNDATLADLVFVNLQVNHGIWPQRKGMESGVKTWEIAPRVGDSDDYAVTKRHALLRRGYPAGALLLAVVETNWGGGHLVLIVRTDRGDYVLDNFTLSVRPWTAKSHRWIKLQSTCDPHA